MFVTIYGTNNIGKSTQVKLLVEALRAAGQAVEYLKYPIYDLEPTGPAINKVLRGAEGQKISELELQELYAQNRRDFEPKLKTMLARGQLVVAEDYTGTGLAWGVTKGANLEEIEKLNQDLLKEDLSILLDGQRFLSGKEAGHLHESNDAFMQRCREVHLELAERYDWKIVNANQKVEEVQAEIWGIVESYLENRS